MKNIKVVLIFSLFLLSVYLIRDVFMPFFLSFVLAFFLHPVEEKLRHYRVPASLSTILVIIAFFTLVILFANMIAPVINKNVAALYEKTVVYKLAIQDKVLPGILQWLFDHQPEIFAKIKEKALDITGVVMDSLKAITGSVIYTGKTAVNTLALLFFIPFITFYMLRDWSDMKGAVISLIPVRYLVVTQILMEEISRTLKDYLYRQLLVCSILATFYTIALKLVGLDSALALGIMSGFLIIIPYLGLAFSCLLCLLTAAVQFESVDKVLIVLGIFMVGQVLEGNIISPKLFADKLGVHPLWMIFALVLGGTFFGLFGIAIAVPTAAVISVCIKFIVMEYKKSSLYL